MPVFPLWRQLLAALVGALVATPIALWWGGHRVTAPGAVATDGFVAAARAMADSYAAAVARVAPSVVNIYSSRVTQERQFLVYRDPLLPHLYGHRLPEIARRRTEASLGSGVVVSGEGHLLTNNHIIKGAKEIRVLLSDGTDNPVELVGSDPDTDLAILKLAPGLAPAIPLGQPEALRVGDVVLAIGNPFGVGQSVTLGIVGATGRNHLGISAIENFIQTDAAINPGGSGGALINTRGELVGINTAIVSNSGGSQGVGFAIPIDLAQGVLEEIRRRGRVSRGWIGVSARALNPSLVRAFGLRTQTGVLVDATVENSPAALAGLRPGDVISEINGAPIRVIQELREAITQAGPHAALVIGGWRGSERLTLSATTLERTSVPE